MLYFKHWQYLTITHQNVAKPSTELAFPSVTICAPGLNMEAVKEAIFNDFSKWKEEEDKAEGKPQEDIDEFMESKFGMKVGEGNIFDTIQAMTLPPVEKEKNSDNSAILENLVKCGGDHSSMSKRRKREATPTVAGDLAQSVV